MTEFVKGEVRVEQTVDEVEEQLDEARAETLRTPRAPPIPRSSRRKPRLLFPSSTVHEVHDSMTYSFTDALSE